MRDLPEEFWWNIELQNTDQPGLRIIIRVRELEDVAVRDRSKWRVFRCWKDERKDTAEAAP